MIVNYFINIAKRYTAPKESKAPPPRKVVWPPVAPKKERQAESTLKVRSDEEIWVRLDELEREEKEEESLQREKQIADSLKEDTEEEKRGTKYQERNKSTKYEEGSKDTNKLGVKKKTGLQDVQNGALGQTSKVELEVSNQPFPTEDVALNTDRSSDGQTRKDEDGRDGSPLTITVTHVLPQPPVLAEEPASQEVRASSLVLTSC